MNSTDDGYMDLNNFTNTTAGQICDKTLGVALVCCTVVGVTGNTLALKYFSSQQKQQGTHEPRNRDLANLLYIFICSIDICTSIAHFPVAGSLFMKRSPVLFNSKIICPAWRIIYSSLENVSMFLVMLLSVCRTISILFPFYDVRCRRVMFACLLYSLLTVTHLSLIPIYGGYLYSSDGPYCYGSTDVHSLKVLQFVLYNVQLGLPPTIAFISFVTCSVKLLRTSTAVAPASSQEVKEQLSYF